MPEARHAWQVTDISGLANVQRRRAIFGPDETAWDPFILWSEDWFTKGAFPWHPHKGFETVTLVLEGQLEHKDSFGGHEVLNPGTVQWTTAGRGLFHAEEPIEGQVKALQLWLNLPAHAKQCAPRHQEVRQAQASTFVDGGVEATVYGGRLGDAKGPAEQLHETLFATLRVTGAGTLPVRGHVGCLYVVEGAVCVDGVPVADGTAIRIIGPCRLEADGTGGGHAVVVAADPLREPVAVRFPFVLSDEAEFPTAMQEFRDGLHGNPW